MTEVKRGDRVRVVLEGVVRDAYPAASGRFTVGERHGNIIAPQADHVVSVEVLPRPLKVGDIIEERDAYEALPLGAVVVTTNGVSTVRTVDGFYSSNGEHFGHRGLWNARKVVYLPESA